MYLIDIREHATDNEVLIKPRCIKYRRITHNLDRCVPCMFLWRSELKISNISHLVQDELILMTAQTIIVESNIKHVSINCIPVYLQNYC